MSPIYTLARVIIIVMWSIALDKGKRPSSAFSGCNEQSHPVIMRVCCEAPWEVERADVSPSSPLRKQEQARAIRPTAAQLTATLTAGTRRLFQLPATSCSWLALVLFQASACCYVSGQIRTHHLFTQLVPSHTWEAKDGQEAGITEPQFLFFFAI